MKKSESFELLFLLTCQGSEGTSTYSNLHASAVRPKYEACVGDGSLFLRSETYVNSF